MTVNTATNRRPPAAMIRIATVHQTTTAIAHVGCAYRLPAGTYTVAELDGVAERGEMYVYGPAEGALVRIDPDDGNITITESGAAGRPAPTDSYLVERIDPALAVDRALKPQERAMFAGVLVHGLEGAKPADWLDQADNTDTYAYLADPWLIQHGQQIHAALIAQTELPTRLVARIVGDALLGCIVMGRGHLPTEPEPVADLALRAALWALGYAEGIGWHPHDPAETNAAEAGNA